ncbi:MULTISPECIES: ABC transporter permease [Kitasatospora]|uniref:Uncharacterized protein n=1 Tax=Kitasatospora setae (strain ATCC 33774 / DSM 43861 / JCM 3304 / KCC A-0304 / NBRC 14216 / KM-6054) TaxID=452652 RepID=E4N445_KITSK|nr:MULTISPECIES: ABC transporter permease [Kitasatospora]BAJ25976.1 hypothetical protein KSE_01250 [Kitasatospora setae KM-6054]
MSTDVLTERAASPADRRERPAKPRLRGLLWLSLRQNRLLLRVLAVFLVLAVADLVWVHVAVQHVVGVLRRTGCYEPESWGSDTCWVLFSPISRPHFWFVSVLQPLVTAFPLLVGVFVGAPLLAQEYERGTIRLVRAQSVGPARWLTARLLVPAAAVLLVSGVLAALMSWVWWTDLVHGPGAFDPPFQAFTYPALGVAPVAWTLFAFTAGVLAGQATRRVLPAMALTAGAVVVAHGLVRWVRPYFHSAVEVLVSAGTAQPPNAWLLGRTTVLPDGTRVRAEYCLGSPECAQAPETWLRYHPARHLVPIQLVEAGVLVALTAVVLVVVFRRVGRLR